MNKQNYQKEMENILLQQDGSRKLLLHSCCAPCSSYCMEYLREYFQITVFYYNPNITEISEYKRRVQEEKKLIQKYNEQVQLYKKKYPDMEQEGEVMTFPSGISISQHTNMIEIMEGDYEPELFLKMAKGLENCPEGGERCFACYELRLRKTALMAAELGFDLFTTTLTISPLKNAEKLNEIGRKVAAEYGISFLPSDFKKKNGYKRSIELSHLYELYRQDYCGCGFSKAERMQQLSQEDEDYLKK